jgi:ferredoxin
MIRQVTDDHRTEVRRFQQYKNPALQSTWKVHFHSFLKERSIQMATIYFSSPIMSKNKKVTAVAGKRDTLLAVAKENDIKIPFECQDGECGSCLVKITHLDGEHIKGVMLTDKEREVLKSIGKLPKHEEERANVMDLPPTFRLACQTVVTDEDLLVQFTGEPGGA